MSEDGTVVDAVELLDRYTCAVLATASAGPASVERMREAFAIPDSTLYRRLPDLVDSGLLTERTRIDAGGNHYRVYETAIDRVTVEAEAGEVSVRVALADDETYTRTWPSGGE